MFLPFVQHQRLLAQSLQQHILPRPWQMLIVAWSFPFPSLCPLSFSKSAGIWRWSTLLVKILLRKPDSRTSSFMKDRYIGQRVLLMAWWGAYRLLSLSRPSKLGKGGGPCRCYLQSFAFDFQKSAEGQWIAQPLYLTVRASAFFLSRAWPLTAPVNLAFMTARTVTVGTTTYLFCDMPALYLQRHMEINLPLHGRVYAIWGAALQVSKVDQILQVCWRGGTGQVFSSLILQNLRDHKSLDRNHAAFNSRRTCDLVRFVEQAHFAETASSVWYIFREGESIAITCLSWWRVEECSPNSRLCLRVQRAAA